MTRKASQPVDVPAGGPAVERIVAAARGHFFAHGFRSVTMDDLAHELGMSKKTLYAHFPAKDDLVKAVLFDKFKRVEADLEASTAPCGSDVKAALQGLLTCLQRHTQEIQPSFIRDIRRDAPELFKLVEVRRQELILRYFGKVLEEGRRAGIIREDIPTGLIIEILLAAMQAIMNPPRLIELDLTPTAGYSTIINVIFEGILTPAGRSRR